MKKIFVLLSFYGLMRSSPASAQKNYPELIGKYLEAQVNVHEFSGAVLVADQGRVIYEKGFGYADREWKLPNTIETKFEIGSLTKQFTATAILQLARLGKLRLDDKLSTYFPGYPKGDTVTLEMLLNHTSGIVDYTSLPGFYAIHTLPLKKDSVIALFKDQPYKFAPGSDWSYSNSNYFLLGYIIEKVTKEPYDVYLSKNVISKDALPNTAINHPDSVLLFRARGYSKSEGSWKNADYFAMETAYSAGSLISTLEDLYRWQKALLGGKIIPMDLVAKMTTPYRNSYGYGLSIDSFGHHLRISHGGAIPGFTSFLGVFPARGICIVVLSNDDGNSNEIADAIASILFNLPVEMPYKPVERAVAPAVLKRYPGRYQLGGSLNFELLVKDDKLYLKPENGGEMELKPESETRFFFARDPGQEIEFTVDASGAITSCYFKNKGSRVEIKKR